MGEERFILNDKDIRLGVCYYPEHWERSLWQEDLTRMKAVGITVIRIGEFAWNLLEPEEGVFTFDFFRDFLDLAEQEGMKVIYGTPTATPPAWLTEKYPEVLNADIEGHLYRHGARRHYNYNSEKYREYCARIVTALAKNYGPHPAIIGWQIDNELNCEVSEFYAESDTKAFRRFLQRKYHGSVAELNEAWGTTFWNQTYNDFDQIYVPRHTIHDTVNPHLVLDFYRFISDSVCSFARMQADILMQYKKPEDFITTNGIFSHIDNHRLTAESLDFMTYDSYPNFPYCLEDYREEDSLHDRRWSRHLSETRAISPVYGIMEQQSGANGWNTRMEAPTPRPGQITLWAMQSIAHGADFVSFFRWRTARYGTEMYWHGILDYAGRDNRRLREIGDFSEKVKKLQLLAGARYEADVAVLKDYDNSFDAELDRWHSRLTDVSEQGLFTAMELSHTPFDYRYLPTSDREEEAELAAALKALRSYRVVFYPHPVIMTEKRAALLTEYVKDGGTLVVGCRAAYKDERGQCVGEKLPGLLAELLGTDVLEYGFLPPDEEAPEAQWADESDRGHGKLTAAVFTDELSPAGKNASVIAAYRGGYYDGVPALIRNQYGKGTTWYFGSTFTEENAMTLLRLTGASEPLSDIVEAPPQVELAVRTNEKGRFLFALNFGKTEADVTLRTEATDLLAGKEVTGLLTLPRYGTGVYRLPEAEEKGWS